MRSELTDRLARAIFNSIDGEYICFTGNCSHGARYLCEASFSDWLSGAGVGALETEVERLRKDSADLAELRKIVKEWRRLYPGPEDIERLRLRLRNEAK